MVFPLTDQNSELRGGVKKVQKICHVQTMSTLPSGNLTQLLKIAIYSEFPH